MLAFDRISENVWFSNHMMCPQDTVGCLQKATNMAKMAIYGRLVIGPCATHIGKWGIPEKSYQNLAQQC